MTTTVLPRATLWRALVASLLAVALLWNPAAGSTQSHSPGRAARKIAMGVSMLQYGDLTVLDAFTASVGGHTPAIWSMWSDWRGNNSAFPSTTFLSELRKRHTVPMIFWQPVDQNDSSSLDFTYKYIAAGMWDTYIRTWARAAKAWGHPIILRFAHEMDGRWFPWGIGNNGNTVTSFVAAWRHIWRIFKGRRGIGARNVRFLWSPLSPCACQRNMYPGNAFVDYVGFTFFNWGGSKPWRGMLGAYRKRVASLRKFTHKPIIVAETGSSTMGGNKAAWIKKGYPAVYRHLPAVRAIVYFNLDMRAAAQQPDWRLQYPSSALTAYARVAATHHFQGRIK